MSISHSDEPTAATSGSPDIEVVERSDVEHPPPAHEAAPPASRLSGAGAAAMAALRIAMGFVFLWAVLDKTLGWEYSTPSGDAAWINGGSPTQGFLSNVDVGPFADTFQDWAGDAWADWLFMIGLFASGVAVILGIGLRLAAVAGTVMMALMWAAEWPLDKTTSAGDPSGSTNPIVDYHVIYALALIAVAATYGRPLRPRPGVGAPAVRAALPRDPALTSCRIRPHPRCDG